MRRAAKVDGNHAEVVEKLREANMRVLSLAPMGKGCPDLLVAFRNRLFLLEVKDGTLPPSERKLTTAEYEFIATWPCSYVVTSGEEAVRVVIEAARPREVPGEWGVSPSGESQ